MTRPAAGPAGLPWRRGFILALPRGVMIRALWLVPIALVVVGAGFVWRRRQRRQLPPTFSLEHVSGDWLAQARGRDEQQW